MTDCPGVGDHTDWSPAVKDATAAAQGEGSDGYAAALTKFRFIGNAVWNTGETLQAIDAAYSTAGYQL